MSIGFLGANGHLRPFFPCFLFPCLISKLLVLMPQWVANLETRAFPQNRSSTVHTITCSSVAFDSHEHMRTTKTKSLAAWLTKDQIAPFCFYTLHMVFFFGFFQVSFGAPSDINRRITRSTSSGDMTAQRFLEGQSLRLNWANSTAVHIKQWTCQYFHLCNRIISPAPPGKHTLWK